MEVNIRKKLPLLFFASFIFSSLTGCASSGVSDSAANQVDAAYQNSATFVGHLGDNGLSSYPNTSGIVQGAAAGSVAGALAVGFATGTSGGLLIGGAGGAIVGGILGAYLNHNATTIQQLENHGAKVFVLGDQVLIVIPTTQVFSDDSPRMFPRAGNTLDLVAQMVSGYKTMSIKVSVFGDGAAADRIALATSQQQADVLVKYLWPRVDTRLLYAAGKGNANLVTQAGGAANSRIEITLEKLPA